jgi:predicted phage terminase large subunit-like protein
LCSEGTVISVVNSVTIEGFTRGSLAIRYDNPKPIPPLHREMWQLCCSDHPKVAIAAPRGHAKSTAITHAYLLSMMLFKVKEFALLVSDTEGQAIEFLSDIKVELEDNEALKQTFGIDKLLKATETNVVCRMKDGHMFRIQAKGSEQKVRGIKWRGKRPDLIVCDDLENDEIVMNPERREKFRRWFMNALVPCGSDTCWIRVVGTILHLDSMLNRLLEDDTWESRIYEAEDGQFKNILWPEQFPGDRLRRIYESYVAQGDPEGYAQEYRNKPVAIENAFFNPDYFFDFDREGDQVFLPNLEYFAAADFAISEKEKADYTAIIVGGMSPDGILHIVDVKKGRWDSERIIEELIATQKMYKPNCFTFETEKIDKAIGPFLNKAMQKERTYLNIIKMTPSKSKTMRASSIRAMHKSGSIRYDKKASWYPDFSSELLMVAESGPRGRHDDMFDAFAYLGLTVDQYWDAQSAEEIEDEEWDDMYEMYHDMGRSAVTGY